MRMDQPLGYYLKIGRGSFSPTTLKVLIADKNECAKVRSCRVFCSNPTRSQHTIIKKKKESLTKNIV